MGCNGLSSVRHCMGFRTDFGLRFLGVRVFMSMAKSDIWYSSEYKMYCKTSNYEMLGL